MATTGHESENITVGGRKAALQKLKTKKIDAGLAGKSDKTSTVSNVTYDSATGELKKTINGTTTKVCDIVQSGFVPTFNGSTGIMTMTPVGGASIAPNPTTGLIEMNF